MGDKAKRNNAKRIHIVTGDLTDFDVDAIVNAANSSLMGGGGVDGAIHSKGGPEILEACKELRNNHFPGGLTPGEAVITTGGRLNAAHVIHTVGPVWDGGDSGEAEVLEGAYRNSLTLAADNNLKSVAFPAISTGVYGYPKNLAGVIAYSTVTAFLSNADLPREIYFVFLTRGETAAFSKAVSGLPGVGER
jgi:O-acetyl-ADP-ribose deacetylase